MQWPNNSLEVIAKRGLHAACDEMIFPRRWAARRIARRASQDIERILGYIEELYVANVVAVDREIMHWGEVYD